jgi:hypothetical protein
MKCILEYDIIKMVIFMELHLNNRTIPVVIAASFNARLKGLIGIKNINFAMLFPKCNSIHTFFMSDEIDVLGLNENNEIIFIERNVKKNKIIIIHRNIKNTSILELPKNTSKSLKIGDKLDCKDKARTNRIVH